MALAALIESLIDEVWKFNEQGNRNKGQCAERIIQLDKEVGAELMRRQIAVPDFEAGVPCPPFGNTRIPHLCDQSSGVKSYSFLPTTTWLHAMETVALADTTKSSGAPMLDTTKRVLEKYDEGLTKAPQILEYVSDIKGDDREKQLANIRQIISRYRTNCDQKA